MDYYHEFTYTVPANYNIDPMDLIGLVQRYSTDKLDSRMMNSDRIHFKARLLYPRMMRGLLFSKR